MSNRMSRITLTINGMHCTSCKLLIEDELEEQGAQNIDVQFDEATQTGTVLCEVKDKGEIISAIESLGNYMVER